MERRSYPRDFWKWKYWTWLVPEKDFCHIRKFSDPDELNKENSYTATTSHSTSAFSAWLMNTGQQEL
jgi:hypothetical protein